MRDSNQHLTPVGFAARLGRVALLSTSLLLLCGCPEYTEITQTGVADIPETQGSNGSAIQSHSSNPALATQPFELDVSVSSTQLLAPEDAVVRVTMQCAFGNVKEFDVPLSSTGLMSAAGSFRRAANVGTDECVGPTGQLETVTWTASFIRPAETTQDLHFDFTVKWREMPPK